MKKLLTFVFVVTVLAISSCGLLNQAGSGREHVVLIKTTMGDIKVKLYPRTIHHTENFMKLVKEHYYDSLLFHRVIPGFVIQGGDPNSKHAKPGQVLGDGGPGYTIPAEICPEYFHKRGALAMAREGDRVNPTRRSSGSQFYIVVGKVYTDKQLDMLEQKLHTKFTPAQRKAYTTVGGTPFLDGQYTVFGEVVEGMDVVDKIANLPRDKYDRPKKDVRIITMKILK